MRPAWSQAPSEQLPEFVTIVIRDGPGRPDAGKRAPARIGSLAIVVEQAALVRVEGSEAEARAARRADDDRSAGFAFTEIEADVGDHTERYVLPLAIAWGDGDDLPAFMQLALARVRRNRNIGHLTDAFAVPHFTYGVLEAARTCRRADRAEERNQLHPDRALRRTRLLAEAPPEIRWLAAEQSNSSLVIGDRVVLKLVRRLVGGIHPEAEMSRYLTKLGYANTGPLFGEVVRVDPQNVPHTLAILQGYIDNQGDAWNYSLDYLRRTVDELAVAVDHRRSTRRITATSCRASKATGRSRASSAGGSANCTSRSPRRPTTKRSPRNARRRRTCTAGSAGRLRCSPPRSNRHAEDRRFQRARPFPRAKPDRPPRHADGCGEEARRR